MAGFTLIEVMIVVVIIAILAAIALPSYSQHVIKTRRAVAKGCLLEGAQSLERFYTINLRYDQTIAGVANALPACSEATSIAGFYTITASTLSARAYTLTATPSAKQKDPTCETLTVNEQGTKTESGTGALKDCW